MKSLEMIQNCNSLEELVNEIKGDKPKVKSFWEKFGIKAFFRRMSNNLLDFFKNHPKPSVIILLTFALFFGGLGIYSSIIPDYNHISNWDLFLHIWSGLFLLIPGGMIIPAAIEKNKNKHDSDYVLFFMMWSVFGVPVFLEIIGFGILNIILLSSVIPFFLMFLGLYNPNKEKEQGSTKAEKRAEQLNILSKWLKEQEEKIIESLKERKNSIRNLKDQLQKYLNTLESKSRDDFLRNKYGRSIEGSIGAVKDKLNVVELSLKSLEEKEKVMTQAIEETINNILPEFRKEQEFLQEMIEIDQVLDKADIEIADTKKLIKSVDKSFINMFTKVNSALEQASVMNQALIEVTNDDFKNINRISEPIESFNVGELQEVVNSTRPKVHS